jgi:acetylornithine deacetylase/succinyl-diaminopimelate desuccinylase-like protein
VNPDLSPGGAAEAEIARHVHGWARAAGLRADAAVVTEPTEMVVGVAHKGFVWTGIEVTGSAAHGSRPTEETSTIPGRCVRTVERRTLPGEDLAVVEAELGEVLDAARRGRHPHRPLRARRGRRPRRHGVGQHRRHRRLRPGPAGGGPVARADHARRPT